MITYRATLDVPLQLVLKVSGLLRKHRAELGTRNGTRALTCWQQAIFVLARFRDKPDLRRLGQGFGNSQSTAYRYKDEGVEVFVREAPSLEEALKRPLPAGREPKTTGTCATDRDPIPCCRHDRQEVPRQRDYRMREPKR